MPALQWRWIPLAAWLVAFTIAARAQEQGEPARVPAPAPTPSPPSACSLLERAIEAQGGRGLPGAIVDVDARFEVTSYDEGHRVEMKVRQSYRRIPDGPGLFRSEIREVGAGQWSVKGFDGKHYWLRDAKREVDLRGRDFERDRRGIEHDRDLLASTLDFFFLENLKGEGVSFRIVSAEGGGAADLVGLERTREGERTMRLFFREKDARLLRVVLLPWDRDPRRVRFELSRRCRRVLLGDDPLEDLWVPQKIAIFYDEETEPNTVSWLSEIRLNTGLDDSFFRLDGRRE